MSFMDRFGFSAGAFATTPLTSPLRSAVLKAWHGKCAYCESAEAEHVDHIIPRAKGGPDCLENYAAACASCNLRKTDLMLPEGMLAILLAKARHKASRVERITATRVVPPSAGNREAERLELVAQVHDLRWAEGEALDMGEASISVLKREISSLRRRIKTREKQQAIADETANLVEIRSRTSPCPTVALLLTERERSRGGLNTVAKVKSAIKWAGAPRRAAKWGSQGVDLAMPQEVRLELMALLKKGAYERSDECNVPFSREAVPHLYEHLKGSSRVPNAVIGGCWMNLISSWTCLEPEGVAEISVRASIMVEALDRAEALGVEAFTFKNTFRLMRIPPVSHCRPAAPGAPSYG